MFHRVSSVFDHFTKLHSNPAWYKLISYLTSMVCMTHFFPNVAVWNPSQLRRLLDLKEFHNEEWII